MRNLKIIFMGTPEFAVTSLQMLYESGYHIAGVITAPDKPQGRGQKIVYSPVKEFALRHEIPVMQPTNLKSAEFVAELKGYDANLYVVVAFRMLPEVVWSIPEYGTFNLHASLLPQYRGAAPINWAIINGETETGVTTFMINHDIDTGSIVLQEKEPISETDDAGSLYERLMHKGAELVRKTVENIQKEEVKLLPQPDDGHLKHAPKIFRESCEINWDNDTKVVRNFVRGLSPYPAAWARFSDKVFKIFQVETTTEKPFGAPGQWTTDAKSFLKVSTRDGVLKVVELQMEGKKRMEIVEFLRGNKI